MLIKTRSIQELIRRLLVRLDDDIKFVTAEDDTHVGRAYTCASHICIYFFRLATF